MIKKKCIICNNSNFLTVWNNKIRNSSKKFTKKKVKILQCSNCKVVFLKKRTKKLENSYVARKIYNKNNSIKEFINFHKPREIKKLNFVKKYIKLEKKNILESNCGSAVLLSLLKKDAKSTTGVDDKNYKDHILKSGHNYYSNISSAIKDKKKFDVIFSLSELEHKYDPLEFLKKMRKIITKNGRLVIRVPNFYNIYRTMLGFYFYKFDFRTSHNFYFSKKNLDILFSKINFKVEKILGYNEYDVNHLIAYMKYKKRIGKKYKKVFSKESNNFVCKNIENSLSSTSLIYILKGKY
tara:strand:+ start:189 stop:1073 length:885 start_codon:yes stop_codon:yes gene_type:complete